MLAATARKQGRISAVVAFALVASGSCDPSRSNEDRQPGGAADGWPQSLSSDGRREPPAEPRSKTTLETIRLVGAQGPERAASSVRVVLRFDRVAEFERGEFPADDLLPRRAWLRFDGVVPASGVRESRPVGRAGLRRIRVAALNHRTTRVTLDLDPAARYELFFLTKPYRVVVDVARGGRARRSVKAGSPRPLRTLVLDPGHGGHDYGARHEDLKESILTLDLAERVAALLRRRLPQTRVLLTRDDDRMLSLEHRVAWANAVAADAFVSIHLNAADVPVVRGGVATFVLDVTDDAQAMRLAARENGTTLQEVTGLQGLLAGIQRKDQVAEARLLADRVQRGTVAGGRRVLPKLFDRGVKSAAFYVLVGAQMPAVLLEASFLTQKQEHRALTTPRYRQALAEGIAEGIVRYKRGE